MTKIKELCEEIKEELEGAKKYAERYIEHKVRGQSDYATMFKKMANDELEHATKLHGYVVAEIKALEDKVNPPQWMMDEWKEAHTWYVEREAFIKQILAM